MDATKRFFYDVVDPRLHNGRHGKGIEASFCCDIAGVRVASRLRQSKHQVRPGHRGPGCSTYSEKSYLSLLQMLFSHVLLAVGWLIDIEVLATTAFIVPLLFGRKKQLGRLILCLLSQSLPGTPLSDPLQGKRLQNGIQSRMIQTEACFSNSSCGARFTMMALLGTHPISSGST